MEQQDARPAEQAVEPPHEEQRSLPLDIIEAYAAKKVLDLAVPDVYQGIKDGIQKGVGKLSQRPDPPPSDPGE